MKKHGIALVLAAVSAAALLAGCGGSDKSASENTYFSASDTAAASVEADGIAQDAGGGLQSGLDPSAVQGRKMVYSAYVRLESKDFDGARTRLTDAVSEYDGYIENTELEGSAADGDRSLNYTVRIPVEHYTDFIAAVGEAGNVLSFNESADDITANYIDVEARLAALEAQRDRLNELAETAESTADLIEIESQLSQVQYELESYTRQMRSMDEQVAYSRVELFLREVTVYTPVTHTFADRIIDAFFSGWRNFRGFFEGLAVFLVGILPFLLLAAVIFIIVRAATAKGRARRKAARAAGKGGSTAGKAGPKAAPAVQDAPSAPSAQDKAAEAAHPDDASTPKY